MLLARPAARAALRSRSVPAPQAVRRHAESRRARGPAPPPRSGAPAPARPTDSRHAAERPGRRDGVRHVSGRRGRAQRHARRLRRLAARRGGAGRRRGERGHAGGRRCGLDGGRVTGVRVRSRWQPRSTIRRAVVIAADGRRSRARGRHCGLARAPHRPRRWAIGAYFERRRRRARRLRRDARARGRYIGVAPVPAGLTNVCLVVPYQAARVAVTDAGAAMLAAARQRSAGRVAVCRRARRPRRRSCSGRWRWTSRCRARPGCCWRATRPGSSIR